MSRLRTFTLIFSCIAVLLTHVDDAHARKKVRFTKNKRPNIAATTGVNDKRYADMVINPVTGEIYRQKNADARRHPASLTKMMTLYLLFEALEQNKVDLDDRMYISELAASQPQTNLSLTAGDRIDVETAIKSLVVRSANDVSVVIAEYLADDVETFAKRMTAKARALGMRNTVFKNPNGLPNTEQITTAKDMAKLGIALKRDFPRYYKYFSTLQFSHDGVTYYTHNRVMLRYAGVDGIKTGYTGMSGFNLVTSVARGGRPLVGVVLGGGSGRWRDDRMITLLDDTYSTLAKRGGTRGKMVPANLPLPRTKSKTRGIALEASEETTVAQAYPPTKNDISEESDDDTAALIERTSPSIPPASLPETRVEAVATASASSTAPSTPTSSSAPSANAHADTASPFAIKESVPPSTSTIVPIPPSLPLPAHDDGLAASAVTATQTAAKTPSPFAVKESATSTHSSASAGSVSPIRLAPTSSATPSTTAAMAEEWGIQVGAFASEALASQAATSAMRATPEILEGAKVAVAAPQPGGVAFYRARLKNLTQLQARAACEQLIAKQTPCFIYKGL